VLGAAIIASASDVRSAVSIPEDVDGMADFTSSGLIALPLALLGALFSLPGGRATALKAARIAGSNWPLVVVAGLIGMLFWLANGNKDARQVANGHDREPLPHWPYQPGS
jgi:hypothetical protein